MPKNKHTPEVTLRDFPPYREEYQKLAGLRTQLTRVGEEITREMTSQPEGGSRTALEARAEALIAGDADAFSRDATWTATQQRVSELLERERVLRQAIDIQGKRVQRAQAEYSRSIAPDRRALYVERVREIVASVQQLAAAVEAEREFFDEIEGLGAGFGGIGPRIQFPELGLSEPDTLAARILREAVEAYGVTL